MRSLTKLEKWLGGVIYALCVLLMASLGLDILTDAQGTRLAKVASSKPGAAVLIALAPVPVVGLIVFMIVAGLAFLGMVTGEITMEMYQARQQRSMMRRDQLSWEKH